MSNLRHVRKARITVESLEGRQLLSGLDQAIMQAVGSVAAQVQKAVASKAVATNPAAASAIVSALGGGVGSEWANLIRRQVRNPQSVVRQFIAGQTTYSTTGITFRTPHEQSLFTGRPYDQLLPLAAGGAVFKNNVMEFATILRGEFRDPDTSYYVFGVDRGAGGSLGPRFAARPGITPDALVTITVGPYGSSATGEIRDLTDGSVQSIDASRIVIRGATLRVFLDTSQFPSRGAALNRYRFAMWTQTQPGTDIADVASFAPDTSMIPIAVLRTVAARR
ncbi:hypothetical protein [Paludisphaera mucosa]|uniref:Uncharacterized protein n=1 Tax=Paludisphaera mucosa TaxID=3030827 RepID=A0ABT6F457_9BACT|nr:hypothetical protein [Paludisphaera mucosa]MDG3002373.1 hypothetical protein [Paludisphaera mucosa]